MQNNLPASGTSFLIRMWKDPQRDSWHGRVEYIHTGEKINFTHPEKIPEICLTLIGKNREKD